MLPSSRRPPFAAALAAGLALLGPGLGSCGSSSSSGSTITTPTLGPGEIDLQLSKTVDDPKPIVGDTVTYELRVLNSPDGADATGVGARDELPGGVTFVSATASQGNYDPGTGLWTVGALSSGAEATLSIDATVTAAEGAEITNAFGAPAADQTDPIAANDLALADLTVVHEVDLAVTKSVDDPAPFEGDVLTYTVEVQHVSGPVDATGVEVLDVLPGGLDFFDAQPTTGDYDPVTGVWEVGTVAIGATETLQLQGTVQPGSGGSTLVNTASLFDLDQADRTPGNDSQSANALVDDDTDLVVTKVANDPAPPEGATVSFTISVQNLGPTFASTVEVRDLLPAGLTYVSHNTSIGGFDAGTGLWTIAGLPVGPAATLDLAVRPDPGTAGQTLTNDAFLEGLDQEDVNGANDADSASVVPVASTNLSLGMTVDEASPVRHEPVTFVVDAENIGGIPATGTIVVVTLPTGLTFVEAQPPAGTTFNPGNGRWTIGGLGGGASRQLTVIATVDPGTAGLILRAQAVGGVDQFDPEVENNGVEVQVTPVEDPVEIVHDALGVPHVYASSDHGAYYGAGRATAERRLTQLVRTRLAVQGRLAQFLGAGPADEYLESDKRLRILGVYRHALKVEQLLEIETLSLLRAYADGVNELLKPGATLHPAMANLGIPLEPWRPADSIAAWMYLGLSFAPDAFSEAAELHDAEDEVLAQGGDVDAAIAELQSDPKLDDPAAVVQQADVPQATQDAMNQYAQSVGQAGAPAPGPPPGSSTPKFSQAWVVSGSLTTDGRAVLVTDPRLPISRPSNVMELHVRGETFEVRGAGVPGTMNLLVGSSRTTAWGATALGNDQNDLFRLKVAGLPPGQYELDGTPRPFEVDEQEIVVVANGPDDSITYRESFFGPVVTRLVPDAFPDEAYSLRFVPYVEPERDSATGFLAMYRAGSVAEFGDALEHFRFPTLNAVFADASGSIGYWTNGAIPARNPAQRFFELGGSVAQSGESKSLDWLELVPHDVMPHVIDPPSGILFSANHIPVGSWYPITLGISTGGAGDTARSARLRELLDPANAPFDRDAVEAPHFDKVDLAERDLVRLGLWIRDNVGGLSPEAEATLAEAELWLAAGAEKTTDAPGGSVAVAILSRISITLRGSAGAAGQMMVSEYGGGLGGTVKFLKLRIAELEAGAPNLQNFEIAWIEDRLEEGFDSAENASGPGPTPQWLTDFIASNFRLNVPAFGFVDGLPALAPNNVLGPVVMTCSDAGTLLSQAGQSYTLTVPVGDPDAARSILPLGTGEPGSVHDGDQAAPFTNEQLLPAPMTRSLVESLSGPVTASTVFY